jgi:hypothetical protein
MSPRGDIIKEFQHSTNVCLGTSEYLRSVGKPSALITLIRLWCLTRLQIAFLIGAHFRGKEEVKALLR